MKKQAGLTLIEVMVTLVIAGFLLAYAIPSYREFSIRQTMTTKVNDMLVDLVFTRSEAINKGVPVRMAADGDWEGGWEILTDFNGNGVKDGLDAVIRVSNDIEGELVITDDKLATGAKTSSIIFSGVGSLLYSAAARDITITHGGLASHEKTLVIGVSGGASVR